MQEFVLQLLSDFSFIAPVIFILIRALAIVIPPIPGILVDIPGIAMFGKMLGFVYAEVGIMLGASLAFWISRGFREPAVRHFASLKKVREWEAKISDKQKFLALVALRLPSNAAFDYLSYAVGLTGISFSKFFFSTLLGNIPIMALFYYFGGLFVQQGTYYAIAFAVALIILSLVFGRKSFSTPASLRTDKMV